ncbi:MAG: hypothetical protein ACJASM_000692 [Salibacteraceae bacterium]|jgi:hypothetical protein
MLDQRSSNPIRMAIITSNKIATPTGTVKFYLYPFFIFHFVSHRDSKKLFLAARYFQYWTILPFTYAEFSVVMRRRLEKH